MDEQIDTLVNELYELTEEEIRIVEESWFLFLLVLQQQVSRGISHYRPYEHDGVPVRCPG